MAPKMEPTSPAAVKSAMVRWVKTTPTHPPMSDPTCTSSASMEPDKSSE